MPLLDCLPSADVRHYVSKLTKNEQMENFGPPIFLGREDPNFLRQIVSAIYRPPFGKVWLSFVC